MTPFTQCKSALKVIEASYWGKPTLCSPIPDTERLLDCGAIPIDSAEALYDKLSGLLDAANYQVQTDRLRERVLSLTDIYAHAEQFCQFTELSVNGVNAGD